MRRPNENHAVQALHSEQTQLDQVAQGCARLGAWEDGVLVASGLPSQCATALMEKTFFPFSQKICLEFSMLQLGNPFEQRSEGTPSLQDLLTILFFFFFSPHPSGNSAASSRELTEIKGVRWAGKRPRKDK